MKYAVAAAILATSSAGFAQGVTSLPKINEKIWTVVPTDAGAALIHKNSGAICDNKFRDLTLTSVRDYTPDGNNSGCQYEKRTAEGLTRMTLFFYTYPGISGGQEYSNARKAIFQLNETTSVKVAPDDAETKNCFNAIATKLGPILLAKAKESDPETTPEKLQIGVAMFNYEIPAGNAGPARSERSLLTVYQIGDWVVKARVNAPAGKDSSLNTCRYAGLANLAEAKVVASDAK